MFDIILESEMGEWTRTGYKYFKDRVIKDRMKVFSILCDFLNIDLNEYKELRNG